MRDKISLRNFHQAKWDEPIIFQLSCDGQRGILIPQVDEKIKDELGSFEALVPESLIRKEKPELPELSQPQVLRHYLRLSQEKISQDINIDLGLGTCTMKYSPKINEQFVRNSKFSDMHPFQDEGTAQGILKIIYDFEQIMKEISGMDAFSFQPGGGGMGIYTNASVMKKYFEEKGEADQRTQIITTILSHPLNGGATSTRGYEVINLMPDENGYPSIENLKAVVSEKTAGMFITNPEDTGVFNPIIKEFVDIIHEAGGLCVFDMADYNGLFGIVRAKELRADMCHFNLHKTFSSPHGSMGPGCAAQGVTKELEKYLPLPKVEFDGEKYYLNYDFPNSIGKVRQFYGNISAVLRAYAWIMTLGAEGLKEVAEVSILNNNYMMRRFLDEVKGVSIPWSSKGLNRLEQVRYSFEKLTKDTGVGIDDINRRIIDYGFNIFFTSHHPMIVPEPYTPEPTESYSKDDIDEYIEAFKSIVEEAYTNPEIIKTAPHKTAISRIENETIKDYSELAVTWRAFKRKNANG